MIEEKNETGSKPKPINDSVIPPRRSDESLLEELLDQRRLRTEREHAAAREINALRSQLRTSKERIANQVALLERQQADSLFLVQQNQKLAEQLAAAQKVIDAAGNLIAQEGRHNTEIAYKRLAKAIAEQKEGK